MLQLLLFDLLTTSLPLSGLLSVAGLLLPWSLSTWYTLVLLGLISVLWWCLLSLYLRSTFALHLLLPLALLTLLLLTAITMLTSVVAWLLVYEAMLLPLLVVTLHLGYSNRLLYALYYLLGVSLVSTLAILIILYLGDNHLFSILALILILLVKHPAWPFAVWLTEVHCEASTEGSVILAGCILKVACIGFLRLVTLTGFFATTLSLPLFLLAVTSLAWTCTLLLTTADVKRCIACWSILHINAPLLLVLSVTSWSLLAYACSMVSHLIYSSLAFLVIGAWIEAVGSRLATLMTSATTAYTLLWVAFLGNLGLPYTIGFVVEIVLVQGCAWLGFPVLLIYSLVLVWILLCILLLLGSFTQDAVLVIDPVLTSLVWMLLLVVHLGSGLGYLCIDAWYPW